MTTPFKKQDQIELFELRSVEGWKDPEGGWAWNNSWFIEHVELNISDGELSPRKIFKRLRDMNLLSERSKGNVCLYDDGDVIEVQHKSTREPIFAFIPHPTK